MSATAKSVAVAPAAAHPVREAKYAETDVITVLPKGEKNPKRGASALRFAAYKTGMTVGAYLDACLALQPEESRYRWRADLAWDVKREYISVAPAPKA